MCEIRHTPTGNLHPSQVNSSPPFELNFSKYKGDVKLSVLDLLLGVVQKVFDIPKNKGGGGEIIVSYNCDFRFEAFLVLHLLFRPFYFTISTSSDVRILEAAPQYRSPTLGLASPRLLRPFYSAILSASSDVRIHENAEASRASYIQYRAAELTPPVLVA